MQSALRPYVTAGVALVGASVIAVSPIIATPTAIEQVREDAVELSASVDPIAVFRQLIQTTITEAQATGQAIINNPAPILPQLIRNQLGQALNLPENLVRQLDVIPNLPGLLPDVAANEIADLQALGQAGQDFLTNIVDGITQGDVQAQLQLAIDAAKGGDFGSAFNDLAALPLVTLLGHEFGNLLLISTVGATLEKPIQDLAPLLPIVGQPLENLGNVVAALPIQAVLVGLPAIVPLNTTAQALGETLDGFIAAAQTGDPGVAFDAVVTQAAAVTQAFLNVAVAPDGGGLVSGLQNLREAIAEAIGKPAPSPFLASANALPSATAKSVTLTAPLEKGPEPKALSTSGDQKTGSAAPTLLPRRRTPAERQLRRTRRTAPRAAICSRLEPHPQRVAGIAPTPEASPRGCGTPSRVSPASVARRRPTRRHRAPLHRRATKAVRAVQVPAIPARAVAAEASNHCQ